MITFECASLVIIVALVVVWFYFGYLRSCGRVLFGCFGYLTCLFGCFSVYFDFDCGVVLLSVIVLHDSLCDYIASVVIMVYC